MTSSKSDTDTVLDALIKGKTPQEILGENGLAKRNHTGQPQSDVCK